MNDLKKGFTLFELTIVMAIIGTIFIAFPIVFSKFIRKEEVAKGMEKIKYDIKYIQSLSYDTQKRYIIEFDDVSVSGSNGVYDYVCFEDKNGNMEPIYDPNNSDNNEVLIDPANKRPMMYRFFDNRLLKNINLDDVKFYNQSGNIRYKLSFDGFAGPLVRNSSNTKWEDISSTETNYIKISHVENSMIKKELRIFPLTGDTMILD